MAAVGAAVATAAWAVLLSDATAPTLVAAACIAAIPICIGTAAWLQVASSSTHGNICWPQACTIAAVFGVYQTLLRIAFATAGPLAQAIVNCNVVAIFAWTARAQAVTGHTVATATACVLYALLGAYIVHAPQNHPKRHAPFPNR